VVRRFPYRCCVRLIGSAAVQWHVLDGYAVAHGFDILDLPPDRCFNFIYSWFVERVKDRAEFDEELNRPLPDEVKRQRRSQQSVEEELQGFEAFAGMVGIGPKPDPKRKPEQ
jgi:hypothetical protein